ncbi:ABC transporter permease subunit [Brevibacterium zhoupengii]|uniref:ABC transporter permease subunit n=1 Tax=Brevibacterium zhoupengii TaxID=2898795 RepID=UPI001E340125|nr:ABC transporter permease subunit [Brevibacterium zhoupengii]
MDEELRAAPSTSVVCRCAIILGGMISAVLAAGAGVFALAAASPANPLAHTIGSWEFASAQARADLEAAYQTGGWFSAWWQWLVTAVTTGDLGQSRILHAPVAEIVASRGLNTIAASLCAAAITLIVVGAVSIALARFPGLAQNPSASGVLGAWLAIPSFLIALIIVVVWGAQLPNPATSAPVTLIPGVAITIALAWAAPLIAAARSSAAEVWSTPWARSLIGRGFGHRARIRTVLPTILGAVRSPALVYLPMIVLGEAAVEAVFAYPGLGNALVQAAAGADLPLLATVTAIAAGVTTGLVLLVRTTRTGGDRS